MSAPLRCAASLQGIARHAGAAVHAMLDTLESDSDTSDFVLGRFGTARQRQQRQEALSTFVGARLSPLSPLKEPAYKMQVLEVRRKAECAFEGM